MILIRIYRTESNQVFKFSVLLPTLSKVRTETSDQTLGKQRSKG
jgi:hypothetical protein